MATFSQVVLSRIVDLNLAETLFFFLLSFTLSVSNIHNPNSPPRLPASPYLHKRRSRETKSLVSLDARRFSSKAIQLLSPKRVNLLISLPDFLLLRNAIGKILCWGMLEDQISIGNIDSLNDTGYLTKFYTGSHGPRNGPITHVYTIFGWKDVLFRVLSIKNMMSLKKSLFFASLQTVLNALSL